MVQGFAYNMRWTHYGQAVLEGNFRPIGSGVQFGPDGHVSGTGTAPGLEGQQLWMFVVDSPDPNQGGRMAIFTGATDSWRAPSDGGTTRIDFNSATTILFGHRGDGGAIVPNILPMPEPSTYALTAMGLGWLGWMGLRRRA